MMHKHAYIYPAGILEHAAHYLTVLYTGSASFQARGILMPWQADAINLLIRLCMEAQC